MTIGEAVDALKSFKMVRRSGWNGKGMYLYLVPGTTPAYLPYVMMKTADDKLVPWLCSQSDLLAEDWEVV